ncbi:MAG: PGPGW domain-containing protein [Alphaproteobacteria bacterium]|nr:PGPGW domain-containing protein [Alphaproteobacteria bacterium]
MTKDRKSGAPHRANWFKLILGWIFLVLGVAGLVLPFLQGILFIAIGLWLLSSESEWARCKRDWLLRRFPQLRPRLERMESHLDERGGRIRAWWWRRWS